jgi:hypothetical protein
VVWPLAWTRGGGEEEGHALAGLGRRHAKGKESGVGHSGTRFKGGRWRGEKGRGGRGSSVGGTIWRRVNGA